MLSEDTARTGDETRSGGGDTAALAFLGILLGAILGWLIGAGALPAPALLPLAGWPPSVALLACALGGGIAGGILGLCGDRSDRLTAAATPPPAEDEPGEQTGGSTARR